MPAEPDTKRVVAFIDGQNLFRSAMSAGWCHHPNYDVVKLAHKIGEGRALQGWNAPQVRFYTGIPHQTNDPMWAAFWQRKTASMTKAGVEVFTRPLRYRPQSFKCKACKVEQPLVCSNCKTAVAEKGHEKGVDVRIALDMVRLGRENAYDVAMLFSQDQDLSEAVDEVKANAKSSRRWIKIASAYPDDGVSHQRGIERTDWLPFDRATYDACVDPHDYRHA